MNKKNIYVTEPSLPDLEEFIPYLEKIWEAKWLTNRGQFHVQLEKELAEFLGVKHLCLFNNGTIALIVALQALRITGEVITTPFSFVATTHSLWWNDIKPVFCDIEDKTYNLDPDKIESLITPKTTAILPVHVYGNPCDNDKIQKIADTYGLKVIYDAAHAFNVKKDGQSILNMGDLSILSFHATKVFNTFEGGAIVCHDAKMKQRIDYLKNFGFAGETTVVAPGINGKMNEIQSAFGLLQLKHVEENILKRKRVAEYYDKALRDIDGLTLPPRLPSTTQNYSYYPILIDKEKFGSSRDEVYQKLRDNNIFARRYFYPLISSFSTYKSLASAQPEKLSNSNKIADQVLCLPIYSELNIDTIDLILHIIK
ncbi:MAG: DegT/DnrJ/EryC1/StrS family aminotransferase [Bacteroidales bacterium]|jgi:dTDP-4-amino-4,6-dideoxygalactose transaminase|nr:DegT/DnrJ/EryC1/StrS family aminotransferase [Bacteroidales bacterium]